MTSRLGTGKWQTIFYSVRNQGEEPSEFDELHTVDRQKIKYKKATTRACNRWGRPQHRQEAIRQAHNKVQATSGERKQKGKATYKGQAKQQKASTRTDTEGGRPQP